MSGERARVGDGGRTVAELTQRGGARGGHAAETRGFLNTGAGLRDGAPLP